MGGELIGHAGTLDRLEEAALERDGIRRLVASDAAVAAHLRACPSCSAERDAWIRTGDALADALTGDRDDAAPGWDALPGDLAGRTLAGAAGRGVSRAPVALESGTLLEGVVPAAAGGVAGGDVAVAGHPRAMPRRSWLLAAAAAVVLLVGGATMADLAHQRDAAALQRAQAQQDARQLADVTATLDALLQEPHHLLAPLAAAGSSSPQGSVLWGPQSGRLAVVTAALPQPPAGSEYRCWVERGGTRTAVGSMTFGSGLAYWAGWVDPSSGIGPDSVFGVSLVPVGSGVSGTGGATPPPVLSATF